MNNYRFNATVVRWVDGDTVELIVDLPFYLTYRNHFRLLGVDTPERGRAGYAEATAYCNAWAPPGTRVTATTEKDDKYGRWLVHLADDDSKSINDLLLASGHAYSYNGGTKSAH